MMRECKFVCETQKPLPCRTAARLSLPNPLDPSLYIPDLAKEETDIFFFFVKIGELAFILTAKLMLKPGIRFKSSMKFIFAPNYSRRKPF